MLRGNTGERIGFFLMCVEQCCDKCGAALVGSVKAFLSPECEQNAQGACRHGFWLGDVPCLDIVSRSLRFQGRSASAGGSVVTGASACPTPVERVQKHIGGVGFIWQCWLEEASAT